MKTIFTIIISIIATAQILAQDSTMDSVTAKVNGLGCNFCAVGLDKKVQELKGIKDVHIDLKNAQMTFSYPSDKNITVEQVVAQVKSAGYTTAAVEILRADGTTVSKKFVERNE